MNCQYCGTELLETIYGEYLCPNHGIVYKKEDKNKSSHDNKNYIG